MTDDSRDERIKRYETISQEADDLAMSGSKEKALAKLRPIAQEARDAGDLDYAAFFDAEIVLYTTEDYPKCIALLTEGLDWAKANGHNPTSFVLRNLGVYNSFAGDEDAAIAWFDKALALNPNDWTAMRSRGVSLGKKGNFDTAIEWFDKALAENPKDWDAMREKGSALCYKGDFDAAIEWFDKALEVNPRDRFALRQKGASLAEKEDFDGGLECFDKALALNPKDWEAMRNKGALFGRKGDFDAAIEWFDKALEVNPKDWNALRQKGVALQRKGDFDAAIEWYSKALTINPMDWNSMREIGLALFNRSDFKSAIEWSDRAIAVNPYDGDAHACAAASEFKLENRERALTRMKSAVRLAPQTWRGAFVALCGVLGLNADEELAKQSDAEVEAAEVTPGPAPSPPPRPPDGGGYPSLPQAEVPQGPDEMAAIEIFIASLREALMEERTTCEAAIESSKKTLSKFLTEASLLPPDRSLFMVLRRWNSFTPAIPASGEERSVGGGYFLWHKGRGTVVDPGLNFIENFAQAGGHLGDIHNVVLTHAHVDHTADFEALRTLFRERNRQIEREEPKPAPSRIRFYLSNTAFQKFAGMLPLKSEGFTEGVFTLNPEGEFELGAVPGELKLRVLPAYHDDILSRDHAVGLLFFLNDKKDDTKKEDVRRVLLTSDTGLYPLDPNEQDPTPKTDGGSSEIHREYNKAGGKHADLMVLHIGSVKKGELDPKTESDPRKACYPNHMGIIGVTRTMRACRPKLALLSEFGEEMKKIRVPLVEAIQTKLLDNWDMNKPEEERTRVVPADLGLVIDIMRNEFVNWHNCAWEKVSKVGFSQLDDDKERADAIGYFSEDGIGEKKALAKNAIDNYRDCLEGSLGHLRRPAPPSSS